MNEHQRQDNRDSWEHTIAFFEGVRRWPELAPIGERLLPLIKDLAASDAGFLFRAGTVLTTLVISTAEQHGLKPEDPYVSVYSAPDGEFWVWYVPPAETREEVRCSEPELRSALAAALARLGKSARQAG
jgi:hypothetical protein